MLNKPLLTTTSFCCSRVKLRVRSINTYLNIRLVLLSLLESTSSSSAAVCCWQQERAVNESRLDPETGHLVCTTRVQLFFASNSEHRSLLKEDSALFTFISLLSALFPALFLKKGLFQSLPHYTKGFHSVI